jgi:hypothetical protein
LISVKDAFAVLPSDTEVEIHHRAEPRRRAQWTAPIGPDPSASIFGSSHLAVALLLTREAGPTNSAIDFIRVSERHLHNVS